ncbi:hypothetical protein GCM10027406_29110 [Leifsonia lichenia]
MRKARSRRRGAHIPHDSCAVGRGDSCEKRGHGGAERTFRTTRARAGRLVRGRGDSCAGGATRAEGDTLDSCEKRGRGNAERTFRTTRARAGGATRAEGDTLDSCEKRGRGSAERTFRTNRARAARLARRGGTGGSCAGGCGGRVMRAAPRSGAAPAPRTAS